jgi:phenylalanyl-tRNA synthetase alpha chain
MHGNMENQLIQGHTHPISQVVEQISMIFSSLGFEVALGPEVESEYYNFDALNIPSDHPARDMWDTFWLRPKERGRLLRTHTSPMQIRYMEKHKPPIRIIVPGKVFRYEATDATHEAQFYQVEGLMIDKNVSIATLKGVLKNFFKKFFETDLSIRLRPSYFPFVEPGVEVDISCFGCKRGRECSVCKSTGWIEIMGAGMVHPKVLDNVKIDFKKWQGFAFGAGVDRLAMLKHGIDDIRLFYSGDLRFINQF